MASWVKDKLTALLGAIEMPPLEVVGAGTLRCTNEISGWGDDSTADILLARGKTKRVYDLHFSVVLEVGLGSSNSTPPKVLLRFLDVSNDTAGAPRALRVEFEGSGLNEGGKEAIKTALTPEGVASSLLSAVRGAVEETVSAFMKM